jgi:hypothetical protein
MATRAALTPLSAEFKTSTFPALVRMTDTAGGLSVLAFDASLDEAAYWSLVVPQGWTSTYTVVISFIMASATSGNVVWGATVQAVTDGDAFDLDAGESYDTENTATTAVPGTVGYLKQSSITLTNNDSSAAADYLRIRIRRVGSNGSDTATGDAYFLTAELRDSAA